MPILSNFPGGSGSGGGGLALAAVSGITTLVSSGKVYVKWTDPDDLVVADSTLAAWGGTLLVRKAGSMPSSRRDGTIVLDSTTRNAYTNSYFCDSGLTDGVTYYYKFFPYTTTGTYTDSTDDEFSATPTEQVAGIASWLVTGMSASSEAGDGKMTIKWTDPAATITSDGVTLATWASTTVVVKAGSYATSKDDANAAYTLKVTTRNQYSSSALTVTGLTNGTTYYISFFPETTDGGINTATSQRTTGTANRITISTTPSQSGTLTYTGNSQTPSWSNYSTTQLTIGGTTSGTNAGSYNATFTPKTDYRWSDGTTTAKTVAWSIGKAAGSLTLSASSVTLNASTTSTTVTVTRAGDGTITATSDATSIATVSVSGNTLTIKSVNDTTGTATITVKVAAGTNHNAPSNKTIAVTAQFLPDKKTLENTTWEELSQIAKAGKVADYMTSGGGSWAIGDTKSMSFNGTTYYVQLIGTEHDTPSDTSAYGQSKAGLTFQFGVANDSSKNGMYATTYPMNSSNTNSGGWTSCVMRSTTMGTMKGYLPTELQNVLVAVNKLTSAGSQSSTINTTSDELFLLSEIEIFGSTTYSFAGEGTQYAFYSAGNSKVRYRSGSSYYWWERSLYSSDSARFCRVNTGGNASGANAGTSGGVSFGFCI